MVCERWCVTKNKDVCERWCVTKRCVKDGVSQSCVTKMVCVKDGVSKKVCERWCVTKMVCQRKSVKDGV